MPQSTSFWDHPIDKLEEALSIRKQIAALQDKLSSLFGSDGSTSAKKTGTAEKSGKRTMSAEARERIAAAQRARWAKTKGTPLSTPKLHESHQRKKKGLTPEGRAKLAAAMKARWAARKKGAPALNAPTKSQPLESLRRRPRGISVPKLVQRWLKPRRSGGQRRRAKDHLDVMLNPRVIRCFR